MTTFIRIARAFPWDIVKHQLTDERSHQFGLHLAKIIQSPKNRELNHWVKELYSLCYWLQDIKLKPKSKHLTKTQMDDYFFGWCNDAGSFSALLKRIRSNFKLKEDDSKDLELFNNKVGPFLNELKNKLTSKIEFTLEDMKNLVRKYLL